MRPDLLGRSAAASRHGWLVAMMILACGVLAFAQPDPRPVGDPDSAAETTTKTKEPPRVGEVAVPESDAGAPAVLKNPQTYRWWVLAPAGVAIFLAVVLRSAVPALAVGVLVAAFMMIPCLPAAERYSDNVVLSGVRIACERYLINAFIEPGDGVKGHLFIILFTLIIGGMVGVIGVNGGTRALVERVARFASSSRRGQLAGWAAGMLVFFDDYANSMIVGPTMRPMYDRLKISRAKLAYIVDSTAAPIASIALIGTWLGAELGYIQTGLQDVALSNRGTPGFLAGVGAWDAFLYSIPYRFYAIFALWMTFVIAITGRDFGPMRRAECRVLVESPPDSDLAPAAAGQATPKKTSAWLAALPILLLVIVTVGLLYMTGRAGLKAGDEPTLRNILQNADSYLSIFYGAVGSLALALLLSCVFRACALRHAVDGAMEGMGRMLPAIVILVLAWALSAASRDLHLGEVLSDELIRRRDLAPDWLPQEIWLPLIVFICAAGVSFATGSSWATMGILSPVVIQVAANLGTALPPVDAIEMFYASVGSVLAGSVFGDHCSPISDTTVLSAVASSCRVEEHVWTQLPYAILVAVVSMGAGNVYTARFHVPGWWSLVFGGVILLILVYLLGRKAVPPEVAPAPVPPELIERRMRSGGS